MICLLLVLVNSALTFLYSSLSDGSVTSWYILGPTMRVQVLGTSSHESEIFR